MLASFTSLASSVPLLAQAGAASLPAAWRWGATLAALGVAVGTFIWATQASGDLEKLNPPGRRMRVRVVLWVLVAITAAGTLLAVASLWEVRAMQSPLSYSTPTLAMIIGGAIGVRLIRALTQRLK